MNFSALLIVFCNKVNFPWLKAVAALVNSFNHDCTHHTFCHPACFRWKDQQFLTKFILSYLSSYLILPSQETDESCKKTNAGREDDVWGAKWIHWRHFHDWSRYWCKFGSDWTIISRKIASLPGGLYNTQTDIRYIVFYPKTRISAPSV